MAFWGNYDVAYLDDVLDERVDEGLLVQWFTRVPSYSLIQVEGEETRKVDDVLRTRHVTQLDMPEIGPMRYRIKVGNEDRMLHTTPWYTCSREGPVSNRR